MSGIRVSKKRILRSFALGAFLLSSFAQPSFATTSSPENPGVLHTNDIESLLEKIPPNLIQQALSNLNVAFSAKLLSKNVFKGLNLNLSYAFTEAPAYRDSLYTRVDQWELGSIITPGSWLKELGSPIYVDIEPGAQIIFVRQFPSESAALFAIPKLANPLDLKRIPFTAKVAMEDMKPGDAVMLPVSLNLLLGVQAVQNLGIFRFTEPAEVVASGQYQIVVRLPNDRVRMRIIAMKSKGADSKPTAQIQNLKLFKMNALNNGLEQIVGKNLLSGTLADTQGQLFILDYMFNLDDPDARDAYDSIFASNFTIRALEQLLIAGNPTNNNIAVISDLTKADQLVKEDASKPIQQRRVAQILEATDNYAEVTKDVNSGFRLIGFDLGTSSTTHSVSFFDSNDKKESYILPIYQRTSAWNAIWNLFSHSRVYTGSTLYNVGDGKTPPRFSDEIITLEVKDNFLTVSGRKDLMRSLQRMIPRSILSQVDFSMWQDPNTLMGSRLYAQVIFRSEALDALAGLSKDDIHDRLISYLKAHGLSNLVPEWYDHYAWDDEERQWYPDGQKLSNPNTTEFIDNLNYVLDTKQEMQSRMNRFAELRENPVFVQAGCGFVMDLLKQQDLKKLVYVQVQLDSRGNDPVRFSFGDSLTDQVYAAMEYIQNVIDNGTFDLRLETFGEPFAL